MTVDIFADLAWRGLIHQSTDDAFLPEWLQTGSRTLYAGFDPTADSLHVGSLMPLLYLRRFQRAGHRPIALVGGATGMIGDPSGKSEERNLLSVDQLQANVEGIRAADAELSGFRCRRPRRRVLVEQLSTGCTSFSYLDFLRDIGKNFPVNVMLAKDSVKSRLERADGGLSYTEFSYMLLQAYDFVHLYRALRLPAAGRRQRSMGQHHRRYRLGSPHAQRPTVRHHLPAADQERRLEDGQDRTGSDLAVGRTDQPLRSSTSTGSTWPTKTPAGACGF